MKKIFAISLVALVVFAGCSFLKRPADDSASSAPSPSSKAAPSSSPPEASSKPASPAPKEPDVKPAPDKAAEEFMESISTLDEAKIKELSDMYLSGQSVPDEYYDVLKPISERMTYSVGSYKVDGDKAVVDVTITSVDAQSAINSILPGAVAHLAAMQLTGRDISNPEKILASYAAKNINWDELPSVTKDAKLYLTVGADGEWQIDSGNPDNYGFANAVSGGGIEAAESLKSLVQRFK